MGLTGGSCVGERTTELARGGPGSPGKKTDPDLFGPTACHDPASFRFCIRAQVKKREPTGYGVAYLPRKNALPG